MERVKNNPLMIYFDKWFDKTYHLKNKPKNLIEPLNEISSTRVRIQSMRQSGNIFKKIPINDPNPDFDDISIQQDDVDIDENKPLKKAYKKALHILRKVVRSYRKRNVIKKISQCKNKKKNKKEREKKKTHTKET